MFVVDGAVTTSASDLKKASDCEFAFLRELDVKLGRETLFAKDDDAMLARAGSLGTVHELQILERYRERFGDGVVSIEQPDVRDVEAVAAAVAETRAALESGSPVVYQATFATRGFIGFADFLVRRSDGRYRVQDAKLARHARVTALLQLAAYAEQLDRLGIPCDDTVELLLGDGSTSEHRLDDIRPVYLQRVARLRQLVDERVAADGPVEWGDRRYAHDGRCPTCELEVQAHRDVLLVGSLRTTQREPLAAAGITTIDELAASHGPVPGMIDSTIDNLRAQARLQLEHEAAQAEAEASGTGSPDDPPLPPPVEVREARALSAIPEPNPGDLFFDFEGDPLYTEGEGGEWNLDYLWGWVDERDQYTALWAHSFAEERDALVRFLELVKLRRQANPGLHIYHYASYERTHLTSIAARHGIGEHDVDQLLADGVLVDLYPIVKRGVRVGSRSYSIKKLEPLYMGTELREADVKSGGDSITEYVRARQLGESADPADLEESRRVLDDLADYNRYDCVSTRRLRDWLLEIARRERVAPVPNDFLAEASGKVYEPSPLAVELRALAGPAEPGAPRDADHEALALASAAIDYHARESKSFWWEHFFRADQPVDSWEDNREVLIVDPTRSRVVQPWYTEDRWTKPRREVELSGRVAPGSKLGVGSDVFLFYDWPAPMPSQSRRPGDRAWTNAKIIEADDERVVVEESGDPDIEWTALPMAIAPGPPPPTKALAEAIAEWASVIPRTHPDPPANPAMDVLRRRPPRIVDRDPLAPVTTAHDYTAAVVASVRRLDRSYLAVQGPPGTGKTYVASHAIARLVADHGYKIGVVSQSHAVVENVLDAVVGAGLDAALVGKALKSGDDSAAHRFTSFAKKDGIVDFIAQQSAGYVVGGTSWDFCNVRRIPRGSLDLLVIDEAGQFSLASTIAVSVAARNLLLLGDPQQLPQVSQAIHPEPVDTSALGWIADGHDVLPDEFGYFLAESRRMHPAISAPVSKLSYEGALESNVVTSLRDLEGVAPGLRAIPVAHEGNTTYSPEEAEQVVELVRALLGRRWTDATDGDDGPRQKAPAPLAQTDLIVVTPYNAQLSTVREALDAAGYTEVPVGTVDKFQGQEAAVAIISLAASSAASAPRGIEFLLLKNRLNVAISRAKWAAFLLYSPGLLDALPRKAEGVAQLSAFIRLVGADVHTPTAG
ncbi:TM0106 family RecB-like putative nuclease [Agromyces protaetiae]|uniref:TM0106 family RecB-like putative nuclease n=1 Tax=Agromyces protaetiae TaxID=2509455 RepID=A0A4P6FBG0_9MICO|nr:TM0106 family RecB-like putative nuclease [Agromyces protaetiae]QAY72956.1 TM0106 family RecB-like putative nuclease [Agromyces protaetiae]